MERERRAVAHEIGPSGQLRVDALNHSVIDGQHPVLHSFFQEQVLQLFQLRRVLGRDVVHQAEIGARVVEFPLVVEERARGFISHGAL